MRSNDRIGHQKPFKWNALGSKCTFFVVLLLLLLLSRLWLNVVATRCREYYSCGAVGASAAAADTFRLMTWVFRHFIFRSRAPALRYSVRPSKKTHTFRFFKRKHFHSVSILLVNDRRRRYWSPITWRSTIERSITVEHLSLGSRRSKKKIDGMSIGDLLLRFR